MLFVWFVLLSCILLLLILFIYKLTQRKTPRQNLVLITSVIHTVSTPLSYGQRSVLSPKERYDQTLRTIASIQSKIPNAYIVIIEGSAISPEEHEGFLKAGCDEVHNVCLELSEDINGPYKSVAEVKMILHYLKASRPSIKRFETLSKISGRYYLTDNFVWDQYPLTKALYQCESPTRCNTRYYRIPMDYLGIYQSVLEATLYDPKFLKGETDIEGYNIFQNFKEHTKLLKEVSILGVRGYIAPLGTEVEDFSNPR